MLSTNIKDIWERKMWNYETEEGGEE